MEPIGLGIAVAQVCGLAGGFVELAKALRELSKNKKIRGDIKASISRLKTTTNTIQGAVESLERITRKYPDSEAMDYIIKTKIVRGLGIDAKNLTRKMVEMATEIEGMRLWRRAQWVLWMREKLNGLIPMITHLHCMIKSAQDSVLVEVIESVASQSKMQRSQTDETFEQTFGQTMRRVLREELLQLGLQLRHQREYELRPAQVALFGSSRVLSAEELIKPMLKLVDTLQETGRVPVSQGSQSSRRSRSTTQSRQRPERANPSTQPSTPRHIADLPSPPRTISGTESSARTILTEPQESEPTPDPMTSQSSLGHMKLVEMNAVEHPFHGRGPRQPTPLSPCSDTSTRPIESEDTTTSVTLSDRTHRPAISGHISKQRQHQSRISVTARLDKSIGVNLISLAQVRNLQLDHGPEKGPLKMVMVENRGFMSVVGGTEAYWWKEDKGVPKTVRLSFHICGHLDEGIILGRQVLGE